MVGPIALPALEVILSKPVFRLMWEMTASPTPRRFNSRRMVAMVRRTWPVSRP